MLKSAKLRKENIFMTFVNNASFVKRDIQLLNEEFNVFSNQFKSNKKIVLPILFIKQFFHLLVNISKYQILISQSAGYHSFSPTLIGKIFNKPMVIIAIGNESINMPEINYGIQRKKLLSWFANYSLKNASLILPVHKSLIQSEYSYTNIKYKNQGIKAFIPSIKTDFSELNNGYNLEKWKNKNLERIENSFLTVSDTIDETRYNIKGIDLILKMAEKFPAFHFTIVGELKLKKSFPRNIRFINRVNQNELLNIYNTHQYYFQLSMSEGFPNALCEAMLCGCIPIGSNVSSIPSIIGNTGVILQKKDDSLLEVLMKKLNYNDFNSTVCREHIINNYPLSKRKTEFLNSINLLLKKYEK